MWTGSRTSQRQVITPHPVDNDTDLRVDNQEASQVETITYPTDAAMQRVMDDKATQWYWMNLRNGTRLLVAMPQGETFQETRTDKASEPPRGRRVAKARFRKLSTGSPGTYQFNPSISFGNATVTSTNVVTSAATNAQEVGDLVNQMIDSDPALEQLLDEEESNEMATAAPQMTEVFGASPVVTGFLQANVGETTTFGVTSFTVNVTPDAT